MHDASGLTRPTNALHGHMHGASSLSLDVYGFGDKPVVRLSLRSYYFRRPGVCIFGEDGESAQPASPRLHVGRSTGHRAQSIQQNRRRIGQPRVCRRPCSGPTRHPNSSWPIPAANTEKNRNCQLVPGRGRFWPRALSLTNCRSGRAHSAEYERNCRPR